MVTSDHVAGKAIDQASAKHGALRCLVAHPVPEGERLRDGRPRELLFTTISRAQDSRHPAELAFALTAEWTGSDDFLSFRRLFQIFDPKTRATTVVYQTSPETPLQETVTLPASPHFTPRTLTWTDLDSVAELLPPPFATFDQLDLLGKIKGL